MWICGSTRPGTTVRPRRSMTRTPGPALGRAAAHADEAAVSNGHRIDDGVGRIHGVNLAVDQRECDLIRACRGILGGQESGGRSGDRSRDAGSSGKESAA